jgi:hypothetical protein
LPWLWLVEGLACAGIVAFEVGRRKRAGPILLDLGVPEGRPQLGFLAGRKSQLGFGMLMLAIGLFETLFARYRFQGLVFVAWGNLNILNIAGAFRHFQIRQAGILGRKLFRWEDIQDTSFIRREPSS